MACASLPSFRATWTYRLAVTPTTEYLQLAMDPESFEVVGIASGVSVWYKIGVYLFIILPQLVINAALWWFGATYIARSPNNAELILNAVAMLFVLEIGDQLAKVTVPEMLARGIDNLPRVPLLRVDPGTEIGDCVGQGICCIGTAHACQSYFGQWFNFGLIAAMVVVVLSSAC